MSQSQELSLDSLAEFFGTDKSSKGHNFAAQYDRILSPIRHEARRILEVGVHEGRSLRMWREYFPAAEIVGIDVDEKLRTLQVPDRIKLIQGNACFQETADIAARLAPDGYDLVIDDGSHRADDQVESMRRLWPLLREGCWYGVEDIEPGRYGDLFLKWLNNCIHMLYIPGAAAWHVRQVVAMPGLVMVQKGAPVTR